MTAPDPLAQAMRVAAEGGDEAMAGWIKRHGLPRLVVRGGNGRMVYADTGEQLPWMCAAGRAEPCARCLEDIALVRLRGACAAKQMGLALGEDDGGMH